MATLLNIVVKIKSYNQSIVFPGYPLICLMSLMFFDKRVQMIENVFTLQTELYFSI